MGDHLGISRRFAIIAVLGQPLFELAEVFYDAVVHERHDVIATHVRMRVLVGCRTVGRPAGVAQAQASTSGFRLQLGRQVIDSACRFGNLKIAIVDRHHAAAIVTPIFQPAQSLDQEIHGLVWPDIADNSTHTLISLKRLPPGRVLGIGHISGPSKQASTQNRLQFYAVRRHVPTPRAGNAGAVMRPTGRLLSNLPLVRIFRYESPLSKVCQRRFQPMPRPGSTSSISRSYVVIPARYASTRLPRKMLLRETGKTLLQHTYEAACAARRPAGVMVATDHAEIASEVERFRGDFVMTSAECAERHRPGCGSGPQTAPCRHRRERAG